MEVVNIHDFAAFQYTVNCVWDSDIQKTNKRVFYYCAWKNTPESNNLFKLLQMSFLAWNFRYVLFISVWYVTPQS
jgi:hypothetical protein